MSSTRPILHVVPLLIRTLALGGLLLQPAVSQAQVPPPITSSGLGTTVTQDRTTFNITRGTPKGSNLFHSFGRFSVPASNTALFSNTTGLTITNILARVTGREQSNILGTIRTISSGPTSFGTANLFLINPAGVMFGPNATLDVKGSFHVSTADYIGFGKGQPEFFAKPVQGELLSAASPTAFGFLGPTAGQIFIDKSGPPTNPLLRVPDGQTLSLVGGNVQIVGRGSTSPTLAAPRGRVQIASVLEGEVPLSEGKIPLSFDVKSVNRLGSINISNALIGATNAPGNGGGTVLIRGGQLTIDRSQILANRRPPIGDSAGDRFIDLEARENIVLTNNTSIKTRTDVADRAGNIRVEARDGNVTVTGGASIGSESFFFSLSPLSLSGQAGDVTVKAKEGAVLLSGTSTSGTIFNRSVFRNVSAGKILVDARSVTVMGGAQIKSGDLVAQGGDVTVAARESIVISDTRQFVPLERRSGISSQAFSRDAGSVKVSAPTVTMDNGFISTSTQGAGNAGNISLNARNVSLTRGSRINSSSELSATTGNGGNVTVNGITGEGSKADSVSISGGSGLFSTAEGIGHGGSITIDARQVQLNNGTISANSSGTKTATAGTVAINANALTINDGGKISVATSGAGSAGNIELKVNNLSLAGRARIDSGTTGDGRGGNVTLTADSVNIAGGAGLFSNAEGSGRGGNIDLRAGQVELTSGGTISAKSLGTGNAGNIAINAGDRFRSLNSTVTTEALQAAGGKIDLRAGSLVYLNRSKVTTSVKSGDPAAGNITIDPQFVVLNHSQIRADAFGGPGGNVNITANVYLTQDSIVSASSARGVPGTINIQASITNVSSALAQLPEAVLHGADLLRASCAARLAGGKASSLVLAGRDGLPLEPGGLLPSPLFEGGTPGAPSGGLTVTFQSLPPSRFSLFGSNDESLRPGRVWNRRGLSQAAFNLGCSS